MNMGGVPVSECPDSPTIWDLYSVGLGAGIWLCL